MSHDPIAAAALDQLFNDARTFRGSDQAWLDRPVSDDQLAQIYDLAKMAPTSAKRPREPASSRRASPAQPGDIAVREAGRIPSARPDRRGPKTPGPSPLPGRPGA